MSLVQLPKHGSCPVGDNWESPHILRAPYQSVMFPHNDKVDTAEVVLEHGEQAINILDHLRMVPMGANVGNSLSFGGGPYANVNLKRKTTGYHRPLAKEPGWSPPGGIQWIFEGKLTDEYYSQARLRRPDTEVYAGIEMPGNEAQIDHPVPRLDVDKLLVPVTPSTTYNIDLVPEFQGVDRMLVIKPSTSVMNAENPYGETFVDVDSTRYIHEKDMISYLAPTFSPFLRVGDQVVPIQLRDPITIALQAQAHYPIDVPLPDGSIVKLKDYSWTIVQATAVSPMQFILEVPTHLKDKPNLEVIRAPIATAQYKMVGEMAVPELRRTQEYGSIMSPLEVQEFNAENPNYDPVLGAGSHHYSSLNTGFVMRPGADQLEVTPVIFGREKTLSQPEPISSYPWV